jgi:hypothetical protein
VDWNTVDPDKFLALFGQACCRSCVGDTCRCLPTGMRSLPWWKPIICTDPVHCGAYLREVLGPLMIIRGQSALIDSLPAFADMFSCGAAGAPSEYF